MSVSKQSFSQRIWSAYTRRLKRDFAVDDADVHNTPAPSPLWLGWEDLLDTLELPAHAAHALTSWVQLQLEAVQQAVQQGILPGSQDDLMAEEREEYLEQIKEAAREAQQALEAPQQPPAIGPAPAMLALPPPSHNHQVPGRTHAATPAAAAPHATLLPPAFSPTGADGNRVAIQPAAPNHGSYRPPPAAADRPAKGPAIGGAVAAPLKTAAANVAVPRKRPAPQAAQPPAKAPRGAPTVEQTQQQRRQAAAADAHAPAAPPAAAAGTHGSRPAGPGGASVGTARTGAKRDAAVASASGDVQRPAAAAGPSRSPARIQLPPAIAAYEQQYNAYLAKAVVPLAGWAAVPPDAARLLLAQADDDPLALLQRAVHEQKPVDEDTKTPLTFANLQQIRDTWIASANAAKVTAPARMPRTALFAVRAAVRRAATHDQQSNQPHQGDVVPPAVSGPQQVPQGQQPIVLPGSSVVSIIQGSRNGSNASDGSNQVAGPQVMEVDAAQLVDASTVGMLNQNRPTQAQLPPTQAVEQPAQVQQQQQQQRLLEARQQAGPGQVAGSSNTSPSSTSSRAAATVGGAVHVTANACQEQQQQSQQQGQQQQQQEEQQAERAVLPGKASRPVSLLNVPQPAKAQTRQGRLQQPGSAAAAAPAASSPARSPTRPPLTSPRLARLQEALRGAVTAAGHAVAAADGPSVPAQGSPSAAAAARTTPVASPARAGAAASSAAAPSPNKHQLPGLWPMGHVAAHLTAANAADMRAAAPAPVSSPARQQQQQHANAIVLLQTVVASVAQVQAGQALQRTAAGGMTAGVAGEQQPVTSQVQPAQAGANVAEASGAGATGDSQRGESSQNGASKAVRVRRSRANRAAGAAAAHQDPALGSAAAAAATAGVSQLAAADNIVSASAAHNEAAVGTSAQQVDLQAAAAPDSVLPAAAQVATAQREEDIQAVENASLDLQQQQQDGAVNEVMVCADRAVNASCAVTAAAAGVPTQVEAGSQAQASGAALRRNPARAVKPTPGSFAAVGRSRGSGAAVKPTASQQVAEAISPAGEPEPEALQPLLQSPAGASQLGLTGACAPEIGPSAPEPTLAPHQADAANQPEEQAQDQATTGGTAEGGTSAQGTVQEVVVQQEGMQHDAGESIAAQQGPMPVDVGQGLAVQQGAVQPPSSGAAQQSRGTFSLAGSQGVRGMVDVVAAFHPLMQQSLATSWENPQRQHPAGLGPMPSAEAARVALAELGVDPAAQAAAVPEERPASREGREQEGGGGRQEQGSPAIDARDVAIHDDERQEDADRAGDGEGEGEGPAEEFFDAAELLVTSPSLPMASAMASPDDFQVPAFNTQLF